jgi:hypothetical protein
VLHCQLADAMVCMSAAAAALQIPRCRFVNALCSESTTRRSVRMLDSAAVPVKAAHEAPQQFKANEVHINMTGMSTWN